jgi:membrane fusion protein, copper/silver efflux system
MNGLPDDNEIMKNLSKEGTMKTTTVFLALVLMFALASCGKVTPSHEGHVDSTNTAEEAEYYTCPMHPQVRSATPGICPICHMDLVKASNGRQQSSLSDTSAVVLNRNGQELANVSTVPVGYETVQQSIRAFGTLEVPDPNRVIISARFGGRIEKLHVNAAGVKVKRGQPLFDIYSPDIIQAGNEYRQALTTSSPTHTQLLAAAKAKLSLFGLTDGQIDSLGSAETIPFVITYTSPASGYVVSKNIVQGVYVTEGTALYELADLSTLWNTADVYESDAASLRVGDDAEISPSGKSGVVVPAHVDLIYPLVNAQSRTVKVRLMVRNADDRLRPNMYTETVFKLSRGRVLVVPASAVLVTGKRNLVYIRTSTDHFEAREIGIGLRFDGKYEVTWGLTNGDVVVREGGYLIDSESQLKTGT